MNVITPSWQSRKPQTFFDLGFRPFFTAAAIFAVLSIFQWMLIFVFGGSLPPQTFSAFYWHAHEMIYGYCMAVIAGFLLTAVVNWTGQATLSGAALKFLLLLWITARISFASGRNFIWLAFISDLLFQLFLIAGISRPVIKCRQWKQAGILGKLIFLLSGNILFYLSALEIYPEAGFYAIYGGLLVVIGLILAIGRRVIPFFMENGLGLSEQIIQPRWLDLAMLIIYLLFFTAVLVGGMLMSLVCSALLAVLTGYRLYLWYRSEIWQVPLLWSLYLGKIFLLCGFLLYSLAMLNLLNVSLAWHAFSYGCIGLITLAMMARVTLGHGGGNIHCPPAYTQFIFIILLTGAVIRVFASVIFPQHYIGIIFISQMLWISAFLLFLFLFRNFLFKA